MIDARAAITTKQGKTYRPVNFETLDSFFIDTALDNDTDTFNITLGDPDHILKPALSRNNEVRCDIFAVDEKRLHGLHLGFADEVSLNEENMLTIDGRDISSVAVDSQVPPGRWNRIPPHRLVAKQARKLKIGNNLHLAKVEPLKTVVSDGTESYWEMWYRIYRHRGKWMWTEPDGSIWATGLNYGMKPAYHFGQGKEAFWTPVMSLEWRANKQQRVYESYVFGHTGKASTAAGFVAYANVPGIKDWIRRKTVISTVSEIHTKKAAHDEALEELFEAEVGAVEIKLLVAYSGKIIRQNRMALVNLPSVGLKGLWFVVGSKIVGDLDQGLYQEVRLREKKFAISKRKPTDPDLTAGSGGDLENSPTGVKIAGARWSAAFIEAANKWHGPWPYAVFLGVLLAICDQETGFRNERRGGHVEWPGTKSGDPPKSFVDTGFPTFQNTFANERRKGKVNEDYAVGPMQLLSQGYKDWADEIGSNPYGMIHDELYGNRWNERSNIIAAARALRDKLKSPAAGGEKITTEDFIWQGVGNYGEGSKYADEVKKRYNDTWKSAAQEAISAAASQQIASGYVNPFKLATSIYPGRIDQGVDYHGTGPIVSPADVVIVGLGGAGWPGQQYMLMRVLNGEHAGHYIYLAEAIIPKVRKGDHVNAGDVIARFGPGAALGASPGIEMGWSSPTLNLTYAKNTEGYYEGKVTEAGKAFARWLKALGAPVVKGAGTGPTFPSTGAGHPLGG
jgi:prophage tail gpP-like protein